MATAHQQDLFNNRGYIVVRALFSAAEVTQIATAFEHLLAHATGLKESGMHRGSQFVIDRPAGMTAPPTVHRVVWCGACEPTLLAIGADPRLLELAAGLLQSDEMDHLINQAHFKMPGDGVSFAWHQDAVHRRHGTELWTDVNGRGSYVQTALAIDPMRGDNGPLTVVPGSSAAGNLHDPPDRRVLDSGEFQRSAAVALELDPGDVVLFGPYTVHRSEPNRSTRPRRALLNGYAYPGANRRVYPGDGAGRRLCWRPHDAGLR